ncbi:MAG: glycosyltransferase, partial [Clostridiales bacterium]|nr:glycosyltransferase [Clostridiales bacterium]
MNLVSVVIPTYNVEQYIQEALESFTNQTLKNIEIIVVDDGSTDSTLEIEKKLALQDDRITVIHQENQGAGIARNTGMMYATGKYIYFFDGDDYCMPTFLSTVVSRAESVCADIVVFDYYRIDEITQKQTLCHGLSRSWLPKNKKCFNYEDVPDRIFSLVNPTPWNKLYRREFVLETGLQFLGLSSTNDITFAALSVAKAEKITYIAKPYIYYRINRKNATTSYKQSKLDNVIIAVESVIEQATHFSYYKEIQNSV